MPNTPAPVYLSSQEPYRPNRRKLNSTLRDRAGDGMICDMMVNPFGSGGLSGIFGGSCIGGDDAFEDRVRESRRRPRPFPVSPIAPAISEVPDRKPVASRLSVKEMERPRNPGPTNRVAASFRKLRGAATCADQAHHGVRQAKTFMNKAAALAEKIALGQNACFEHVAVAVEARMELQQIDPNLDGLTLVEAVRQGRAGTEAAAAQAHLDSFKRVYERTNEQLDFLYANVKSTHADIRLFVKTGNWRCSDTRTGCPTSRTSAYFKNELEQLKEWQRDFNPGNRDGG